MLLLRYRTHTNTLRYTSTQPYTNTYTHTHYTLECWWSNIGVEFDIGSAGLPDASAKKGGQTCAGHTGEGGTTPTTVFGTVEPRDGGGRKVPGGKEQIPLGADGMWRAASSRESFKG